MYGKRQAVRQGRRIRWPEMPDPGNANRDYAAAGRIIESLPKKTA
jgi:hypothetical protein